MRTRRVLGSAALIAFVIPSIAVCQASRGAAAVSRDVVMHAADSIADAIIKRGRVAAMSIAVTRGRDTLVMKGYGLADIENDLPATAQTVYRIGSVTKQFTSVAVMQLIEQGKVSLDDDVTKFVPNAPTHGRKVLVRHLLNHTSGIPSYTDVGNSFGLVMRLDLSHDSLLATVKNDSLQFEPGTHFYYNNTGYFLLGMIIEKVTGKPYGDYLKEALFTPNGLSSTVYCGNTPLNKHRARGYNGAPTGLVNADFLSMDLPYAAGSLCSTIGDLVTWTRLLHSGKLVKAPSFAAMTTPVKLPSGRPMAYGFGLFMDTLGTHRRIHHGGGINGFISELAYYPDDSLTVVVLSNTAPAPSDQVADNMARVAFRMPFAGAPERPGDLTIPADEITRLAGNYKITWPDGSKRSARIYADSAKLMLQVDSQPAVRMMKQAAPNTYAVMGQGRIVFDIVNGAATGFFLDRGARPLEAVRVP
jgi:CubicO group peptidase (beta-lactamase class C family)